MQFSEMDNVDLRLTLLNGSKISIENLEIIPYTLKEIREYGYSKYMKNLQWISLSVDDFIDSILEEDKRESLKKNRESLRAFDFYIKLGGEVMQKRLIKTLSMVFRTDDIRVLEDGVVAIGFIELGIIIEDENGNIAEVNHDRLDELDGEEVKIVHRENFDDLVKIIKLQNYLEQPSESDVDDAEPADEETRALMEQMKSMREEVERRKRQQNDDGEGEGIDLPDIVSAVSAKSNSINKLNIWDFTLYQIYDEYARLELIDSYDFSVKAMMAGAKDVDLKHWSSKL